MIYEQDNHRLLFLKKNNRIKKKKNFRFTSFSIESCKIGLICPIIHRPVKVIVVLKLFRRLIVNITFSL
jgi:hypothetical protein